MFDYLDIPLEDLERLQKSINKFKKEKEKFKKEKEKFKKDLKILKILKKILKKKLTIEIGYYDSDIGCEAFEYIAYNGEALNIESQEEFDLLKEWLENE